jgi:hypothetical protein
MPSWNQFRVRFCLVSFYSRRGGNSPAFDKGWDYTIWQTYESKKSKSKRGENEAVQSQGVAGFRFIR